MRRSDVSPSVSRRVQQKGWLLAPVLSGLLALACGSPAPPPTSAAPTADKPRRVEARLTAPIVVHDVGFEKPESIVHDREADVYLVSNIAGSPLSKDDRAFISRVRPDGTVESLKWIDAAKPSIELHAPKGMAIVGDTLYVADIDQVRMFDRATGHLVGSNVIPGASFLNDVSAAPDGTVYVSDSGLSRGLTPTGTDAIYRITPEGSVGVLSRTQELGQPSGLWALPDGVWVVGFGSGEVYRLDRTGNRTEVARPPKGSLDGIAVFDKRVFVSSWEASAVFERKGDKFTVRIPDVDAPSDLAIDQARGRLLITHYNQNTISIHPL